jgi:hypothetical protein
MTQCEKIVDFLNKHGSITDRQASYLGIRRLASRIFDLKADGYKIKSELIKVKNADGSYSHVGKYSFLEEKNA